MSEEDLASVVLPSPAKSSGSRIALLRKLAFSIGVALVVLSAILGLVQSWRAEGHPPGLVVSYDDYFRDLLTAKEYDRLIAEANLALRITPLRRDVAFHFLGMAHVRQGDFVAASESFRRFIRLEPDSAQGHYNLGLARQQLGEQEAAAEQFRRAIQDDQNFTAAHYHLGRFHEDRGRLEKARAEYERALRSDPDCAPAARRLRLLMRKGSLPNPRHAPNRETQNKRM